MAYSLITPIKCTDMSTSLSGGLSSTYGVKLVGGAANGAYVKCTGIDPTKLVFFVTRNSSECSSAEEIFIKCGSTAGKDDFEPGAYSTLRNFTITVSKTTNFVDKGSTGDGSWNIQFFKIAETARFLDTDQYLKISCSVGLTSATNQCHGAKIGALYLP
jgi:hypothetical protein